MGRPGQPGQPPRLLVPPPGANLVPAGGLNHLGNAIPCRPGEPGQLCLSRRPQSNLLARSVRRWSKGNAAMSMVRPVPGRGSKPFTESILGMLHPHRAVRLVL